MEYACAGGPVSLPKSACHHVRRVPKWRLKGTGKLFSGFLRCVEVSHNLDHMDMLYRGVHIDRSL